METKKRKTLSEEHKKKLSIAHKGFKHSEESKIKMSNIKKGKKLSKEHRHNLSVSHTGLKQSEETIRKRVSKTRGQKRTFKNPALRGARISKALSGRIMSIEEKLMRKKVFSNPIVRKRLSDAGKLNAMINPNSGMKNKHHSEKSKIKMSKSKIGQKHTKETKIKISENNARGFLGKKHTKETIEQLIKYGNQLEVKEARSKQMKKMHEDGTIILPKKDTTIEVKIQNFLKQLGIEFFTHQYIKEIKHGYQCDILILSMNIVIECDGDYWHKYPIGNDIDHIRTSELLQNGFKVLRLWERDIRIMDINCFQNKLNKLKLGGIKQ